MIGQESGSERVLKSMKKGTKSGQVPAVEALKAAGMNAEFSSIHGYPGEDAETSGDSRKRIANLNATSTDRPVVLSDFIHPFCDQDLAEVEELANKAVSIGDEVVNTFIATSKLEYAPASRCVLERCVAGNEQVLFALLHPRWHAFHRFAKAFERGVCAFIEHNTEGTPLDELSLRRARDQVAEMLPPGPTDSRISSRARRASRSRLVARLWGDMEREQAREQAGERVGALASELITTSKLRKKKRAR